MGEPLPKNHIHDVVVAGDSGTDDSSDGSSDEENLPRNAEVRRQMLTEGSRSLGLSKRLNCR
jgi:hypothetical protein